jgi:hypothetical protein
MGTASGSFDVKLTPQAAAPGVGDPSIGRLALEKQYHGDLEAESRGEMLGVRTDIEGSAGYVAMERVTGTLGGKRGSFTLQHSGTMTRGASSMNVTVVPDSGTGPLFGLAGVMAIIIEQGKHSYRFEFTLPE